MKNLNLLRMTGIGIFGVISLSPGSTIHTNRLTDELRSVPVDPSMALTVTAFVQETKYPNNVQQAHQPPTECPTAFAVRTSVASADSLQKSSPERSPRSIRKVQNPTPTTTAPGKDSCTSLHPAMPELDTAAVLVYQPADPLDEGAITFKTCVTTIQQDNNQLRPPTTYVDEAGKTAPAKARLLVPVISTSTESGLNYYPNDKLNKRMEKLSSFANEHGYSTRYAFMLNLGLKSGRKRFLIVDLEQKSVITSGLVAHGRGYEKFTLNKKYSNKKGSSCSSLGLYKVGKSYYGTFGKSFRLIGLEKSNNNALNRAIVLHAMGCIPDEEIDYPICQSEGCPSVSPAFLKELNEIIQTSPEPILLWTFDPVVDEAFML